MSNSIATSPKSHPEGMGSALTPRVRAELVIALTAVALTLSCGGGAEAESLVCGPGTEQSGNACVPVHDDAGGDVVGDSSGQGTAETGTDGNASQPPCATTGHCPSGPMVTIQRPVSYGGPFKIDAHETTVAEYAEFLEAARAGIVPVQKDEHCAWNYTYEPDAECIKTISDTGELDYCTGSATPIYCIDQCDAKAYCEWAGKRLCSDSEPSEDLPSAWGSEVYSACSNAGANPNPNASEMNNCGSCSQPCQDSTPGVYSLSASFAEWTSYCRTMPDPNGGEPRWVCSVMIGIKQPTCNNRYLWHADTFTGVSIRCCQ